MLVSTISYLLFVGFISLLRFKHKFDKFIVPLITVAICYIFYLFCNNMRIGAYDITTLLWDSSKSGDIKIDIISSKNNYQFIFPFFVITVLALINNLFFRYEQHKKNISAILIFHLISLIMLVVGNNLIQIITFVFVIDILSQLLIKDVYASRRYSMYNLVADMGLFLVMAMLKGKLETLDVENITKYYQTGRHRDFIMFVLMISLFIKFGFFLFQSYLLDLKNTKFHKLILLPYISTPMVALILFVKFYPLLIVSPSFEVCLNIVVFMTMIWGSIGAIVINNLKEKIVYLNMLVIALLAKLLESMEFVFNMQFSLLLILGFCFNLCLYYTHYYINRVNNLLAITQETNINRVMIKVIVLVFMFVGAAFCSQLQTLININNLSWVYLFIGLFTVVSSHIFAQILSFKENALHKFIFDFKASVMLVVCWEISGFVLIQYQDLWLYPLWFCVSYLFMVWLYPFKVVFENKKLNHQLQKIDVFAQLYDVLIVKPIKIIGRWLNVLFDFMFIEKTLTTIFASINGYAIRIFRKATRNWKIYYLFNLFLAVAIFVWCFLKEDK